VINPDGTIVTPEGGLAGSATKTRRAIDERTAAPSLELRNLRTAQETLTAAQERVAVREANERGTSGQLLGSVTRQI
jgi:hypothetical protein